MFNYTKYHLLACFFASFLLSFLRLFFSFFFFCFLPASSCSISSSSSLALRFLAGGSTAGDLGRSPRSSASLCDPVPSSVLRRKRLFTEIVCGLAYEGAPTRSARSRRRSASATSALTAATSRLLLLTGAFLGVIGGVGREGNGCESVPRTRDSTADLKEDDACHRSAIAAARGLVTVLR